LGGGECVQRAGDGVGAVEARREVDADGERGEGGGVRLGRRVGEPVGGEGRVLVV